MTFFAKDFRIPLRIEKLHENELVYVGRFRINFLVKIIFSYYHHTNDQFWTQNLR